MIISRIYLVLALLSFPTLGFAAEPLLSTIPLDSKHWIAAYNGFGEIEFKNHALILSPRATEKPSDTHAALLLTKRNHFQTNFELEIEYEVKRQLRTPANPWETFWIFFQYQQLPKQRKKTNYFVLKTKGFEVGRAWNSHDQAFSHTNDLPALQLGKRTKIRMVAARKKITFYLNDEKVSELKRLKLFRHAGKFGLYAEDSVVEIYSVRYRALP